MNNFDSILGTSSELEDVLFKQLDNKWSLFIKKLQSTNDISQIDQQDYTLLSQFIAWQHIRSPFMRDEFNRMKENQHKLNNFIERFKLVTKLHSSFYKKALTFNWLRDESEFLTSDNPCFLYSSYPIQFMTITKKLTITWEDSEKLIIYKNDQNRVFANEINKLIASDARRYVIGSEKNILEEAVEQTKHHPGFLEKI